LGELSILSSNLNTTNQPDIMSPSIFKIIGTAAMSLPLALGQLTLTVAPLPNVVTAALNAVAPAADGSLSACSVADARLAQCVRQVEGPFEELEQILPCACCSARRPFSTAYDACASYIATSLTHLSSDYTRESPTQHRLGDWHPSDTK
jgi:hypothetical protein